MQVANLDADTERAARMFLSRIEGRYDMTGAILFGSRARRTHRPDSDADVAYDVLLETGIRVQPLPIWEDQWSQPECYSNPRLLANIAREGVAL